MEVCVTAIINYSDLINLVQIKNFLFSLYDVEYFLIRTDR